MIRENAADFAQANGISVDEAVALLTAAALDQVDAMFRVDDRSAKFQAAIAYLDRLGRGQPILGTSQTLFQATEVERLNHQLNAQFLLENLDIYSAASTLDLIARGDYFSLAFASTTWSENTSPEDMQGLAAALRNLPENEFNDLVYRMALNAHGDKAYFKALAIPAIAELTGRDANELVGMHAVELQQLDAAATEYLRATLDKFASGQALTADEAWVVGALMAGGVGAGANGAKVAVKKLLSNPAFRVHLQRFVTDESGALRLSLASNTDFDDLSKYVKANGKLPGHYITKAQAKALGWVSKQGNLADVAPGKSIGGDVFRDDKGHLPAAPGRIWYEADVAYSGGYRNTDRLVYSSDGLIYKSTDHYLTLHKLW